LCEACSNHTLSTVPRYKPLLLLLPWSALLLSLTHTHTHTHTHRAMMHSGSSWSRSLRA